jgi:hypothetical protein
MAVKFNLERVHIFDSPFTFMKSFCLTNPTAKVYTAFNHKLGYYRETFYREYCYMNNLPMINYLISSLNKGMDFIFLWGGLFIILQYPFRFFAKGMNKYDKEIKTNPSENKGGELVEQTLILLIFAIITGFLWVLPELVRYLKPEIVIVQWWASVATAWRWLGVYAFVVIFVYAFGHAHGGSRWFNTWIGHVVVISFGLFFDGWMGIIFISLPILLAYYSTLYRLAMVILPTNTPEDQKERKQRFVAFVSYVWGIQFPMVVIDGHAWKKTEPRISGDFTNDIPVSGLIWTKSHEVVATTKGTKFGRVAGPGLIFSGHMERVDQVFDLRRQIRSNEINAVTEDGISIKLIVFAGFRVDQEEWTREQYRELRNSNPLFNKARIPINNGGSFPFSPQRIQATLGTTSSKANVPDSTIYWDQWAMNVVEDQARKVIAQKKLDELWRPSAGNDKKFDNALDVIAREIVSRAAPILRASGILLFVARVANFSFPKEKENQPDEITQQQIENWVSEWEDKRSKIMVEAQADAENAKQKARRDVAAQMLQAIAEGLQMTQEISPNLPPHITAMLFSALLEYIDKSPDEATSEEEEHYIEETQDGSAPYPEKKS